MDGWLVISGTLITSFSESLWKATKCEELHKVSLTWIQLSTSLLYLSYCCQNKYKDIKTDQALGPLEITTWSELWPSPKGFLTNNWALYEDASNKSNYWGNCWMELSTKAIERIIAQLIRKLQPEEVQFVFVFFAWAKYYWCCLDSKVSSGRSTRPSPLSPTTFIYFRNVIFSCRFVKNGWMWLVWPGQLKENAWLCGGFCGGMSLFFFFFFNGISHYFLLHPSFL